MEIPCVPEWDPSEPEPFYRPTGQEKTPVPAGEKKGNVVYCIDHSNFWLLNAAPNHWKFYYLIKLSFLLF